MEPKEEAHRNMRRAFRAAVRVVIAVTRMRKMASERATIPGILLVPAPPAIVQVSRNNEQEFQEFRNSNDHKISRPFITPNFFEKDSIGYNLNYIQRLFVTFEYHDACIMSQVIFVVILLAILLSITAFITSTDPQYNVSPATCDHPACDNDAVLCPGEIMCEPRPPVLFNKIDEICVIAFTVDYALRILTCISVPAELAGIKTTSSMSDEQHQQEGERPYNRYYSKLMHVCRYMVKTSNIIDICAILPFYIELGLPTGSGGSSAFVRVLRLGRLLRLLKLSKHNRILGVMTTSLSLSIPGLFLIALILTLTTIVFASIIYNLERGTFRVTTKYPDGAYMRPTVVGDDEQKSCFRSIAGTITWTIISQTTVGYGAFYPTTASGRAVTCLLAFTGMLVLALPVAILGDTFSREYERYVAELAEERDAVEATAASARRLQKRQRRAAAAAAKNKTMGSSQQENGQQQGDRDSSQDERRSALMSISQRVSNFAAAAAVAATTSSSFHPFLQSSKQARTPVDDHDSSGGISMMLVPSIVDHEAAAGGHLSAPSDADAPAIMIVQAKEGVSGHSRKPISGGCVGGGERGGEEVTMFGRVRFPSTLPPSFPSIKTPLERAINLCRQAVEQERDKEQLAESRRLRTLIATKHSHKIAARKIAAIPWVAASYYVYELETVKREYQLSLLGRLFMTLEDSNSSMIGRAASLLMVTVICLSVACYIMSTIGPQFMSRPSQCVHPVCHDDPTLCPHTMICEPQSLPVFDTIDEATVIIFTVEFLSRLLLCWSVPRRLAGLLRETWDDDEEFDAIDENRLPLHDPEPYSWYYQVLRYSTTIYSAIDIVAIVPYYIGVGIGDGGSSSLAVVRVLRLARVMRLLKLLKRNEYASVVSKTLIHSLPALSIMLFLVLLVIICFGSIEYVIEQGAFKVTAAYPHGAYLRLNSIGDGLVQSPFRSIAEGIYWAVITSTTVGYGDFSATSAGGRTIVCTTALFGVVCLTLPISVMGRNFMREYKKMLTDRQSRFDRDVSRYLAEELAAVGLPVEEEEIVDPKDALINVIKCYKKTKKMNMNMKGGSPSLRGMKKVVVTIDDRTSAAAIYS